MSSEYKPHPLRIQRKRTKGWKLPGGAVIVTRPTKWGNPFAVGNSQFGVKTREDAVKCFREMLRESPNFWDEVVRELKGKQLACWCSLSEVCHADVLCEIANE